MPTYRPDRPERHTASIVIYPDQRDWLEAQSYDLDRSIADIIRELIDAAMQADGQPVPERVPLTRGRARPASSPRRSTAAPARTIRVRTAA